MSLLLAFTVSNDENEDIPHAAMSGVFQASRVPSGHGFPAAIKNPQPDGSWLALASNQAARGNFNLEQARLACS